MATRRPIEHGRADAGWVLSSQLPAENNAATSTRTGARGEGFTVQPKE